MKNITRKLITTFAALTALTVVNAFGVYDPNLGRWLNRDPLGEAGGINLHQFVGNNPVNRIDPDGLADFNLDYMPRGSDVLRGSSGYYIEYSIPDPKIIEQYTKAYGSFMANAASFVPVEGVAIRGFNVARNVVTRCRFFQKVPLTALKLPVAKSGAILGPEGPGQFVMRGGGTIESAGVVRTGSELNRVFDSRWQFGRPYSQPMGGSFSPGSTLPTSASQAIFDRGLNWPGVVNNAELGVIYKANRNLPATFRTSLGGTAPEIKVLEQYRSSLKPVGGFVPIHP